MQDAYKIYLASYSQHLTDHPFVLAHEELTDQVAAAAGARDAMLVKQGKRSDFLCFKAFKADVEQALAS